MTRPTRVIPPCLACRHTPGHADRCPHADAEATYYLQHPLPDGHRYWTPAGIRYTGTPARRTALRALMVNLHWMRMIDRPKLPMSSGLLINQILAGFGSAARKTARVGHNNADFLTVLACGCDPWRCVHDHHSQAAAAPQWLSAPDLDTDLLVNLTLVAVELRWADTWQTFWFADVGEAVNVAIDTVVEASPPGISMACHRRWCDRCPGDTKPGPRDRARTLCSCPCHTGTRS